MSEAIFCSNNGSENLSARLLKSRTILLFGELDEKKSEMIISALLYLAQEDPSAPIKILINSVGGDETEALAIFDILQNLPCSVQTVCVGKARGMAALLLAGGTNGERAAYANSEIMISQVSRDRTFGQASDIELETEHLLMVKKKVIAILAKRCGLAEEKISADIERNYWLFAEDALKYGLIDKIF